jgi:hypothetical protein
VKRRALARWVVGTWTSSFTAAKASICLGILLWTTTLVYVAYCLFFGGSSGWAPVLSRDAGHVAELHADCSSVIALRDHTSIDMAHRLIIDIQIHPLRLILNEASMSCATAKTAPLNTSRL